MSDKLKSRKLWAFIATFVIALANFVFGLGMPAQDVLYLVGLTASYLLGQGYVDAKQQKVDVLPSADLANSLTNIIQAEIAKTGFGKNLPMEEIFDMFRGIMKQELSSVNTFTISPAVVTPVPDAVPTTPEVASEPSPVDPIQQPA